jgi:hypothetical protein
MTEQSYMSVRVVCHVWVLTGGRRLVDKQMVSAVESGVEFVGLCKMKRLLMSKEQE